MDAKGSARKEAKSLEPEANSVLRLGASREEVSTLGRPTLSRDPEVVLHRSGNLEPLGYVHFLKVAVYIDFQGACAHCVDVQAYSDGPQVDFGLRKAYLRGQPPLSCPAPSLS